MRSIQYGCVIVAAAACVVAIVVPPVDRVALVIAGLSGMIGLMVALARSPRASAVVAFMTIASVAFMPLLGLILWPLVLYCGAVVVWHLMPRRASRTDHAASSR